MKNIIYTCIGLVMVLFSSCTEDFEPDFDQNATERYSAQKSEFGERLQDAEYGWILQNFPSTGQELGGYNYYLNFKDDSKIIIRKEGKTLVQDTLTTYALKQSSGLYLSLDTYNLNAHDLANPSPSEYQGKGGDYEFTILTTNASNDTIDLLGKRSRNHMRLIKLKESWADYDKKVVENIRILSGKKLVGTLNNKAIEAVSLNGRRIGFTVGDDYSEEAFIYTDKGIYFYEPIMIGGKEYQELILNAETNELISLDGAIVLKIISPPIDFSSTVWVLDVTKEANRSAKMFDAFIKMYNANKDRYGIYGLEISPRIYFGSVGNDQVGVLIDAGRGYYPTYKFKYEGFEENENYLSISDSGEGLDWIYFTHLNSYIITILSNSPYIVELDNKENPTQAKLTSIDDPDFWFYISKN